MTAVLELEKTVTRTLQDLQTVATEKKDFHLIDFIQRELLGKKVNVIKEIGDCLTKIKRAGDGPGQQQKGLPCRRHGAGRGAGEAGGDRQGNRWLSGKHQDGLGGGQRD